MEDYTRMNKTTGVWETNKQFPRALNKLNSTISINEGNKAVRQRGQSKFMMEALGKGLPLMLTKLKKKRDTANEDDMIQFYTESNQNHPSSAEYHHSFKSTGFFKNPNRANLCRQFYRMPSGDPQVDILKKKIKKQSHWHHKFCAAGCGLKT
eukprot:507508-Ditylum_brightwellii.AAC.1